MAITLNTAKTMLQAWLDAELAVTAGQSYQMGARRLQRCDLPEICKTRQEWTALVNKLSSGRTGCRVMRAIPRDL